MDGVISRSSGDNGSVFIDRAKNVLACVTSPHVLLVGNINITIADKRFNVTCNNCTLTNCVSSVFDGTTVMVRPQPSFVILPVNVTGPLCGYRFMSASSFVKVFP